MRLLTRIPPQTLRTLALVAVLVLVALFFASQIPNYLNGRLFNRISSSVAVMAFLAAGQAVVILTRNVDLSVGSVCGFTAYAVGGLVAAHPGIGALPLILAALAVGAGFGALNGVLVAWGRAPSIIITLATMALIRSALVEYSGSQTITVASLPQWLVDFPNLQLFAIGDLQFRAGFVAALGVVLAVHLALTWLRPMRQFYAVGSNPEAAEMAGIATRRVVFSAFVLSGALAGLAGLMFLARFGNITVVAGLGFELKSVASAVVGGVNIFGGSGTVFGAFLGAFLVDLIEASLIRWAVVSEFWREAVLGALILAAVATDTIFSRRLARLMARREKRDA